MIPGVKTDRLMAYLRDLWSKGASAMDEETEELSYLDFELLSVNTVEMVESEELRAGISLIDDDGAQIHVTLSRMDAERLVLALAATVYDLRDDEEFCRGG